ncbi:MAG: hypothetical protein CM15mP102_09930 [Flavobacteriales bacterium]|nr:MAG: hypothetical protein CM15mP102_09930 [Flavobacteriales bacterium]
MIPIAINQAAYRYLKQKYPLSEALAMPRVYKYEVQYILKVILELIGLMIMKFILSLKMLKE